MNYFCQRIIKLQISSLETWNAENNEISYTYKIGTLSSIDKETIYYHSEEEYLEKKKKDVQRKFQVEKEKYGIKIPQLP